KPDALLIETNSVHLSQLDLNVPVIAYGEPIDAKKHPNLKTYHLPSQFDTVTLFELFCEMELVDKARVEQKDRLEESQQFLDLLMYYIPDAICYKDMDSLFTKINYAQAHTLGVASPEEAIGKKDEDFFEGEQSKEAFNDEQLLMENGIPLIKKLERLVTSRGERYVREIGRAHV